MSTTAEVRRLAEPIVAWNDDLVLMGREIVLLPVNHFMRGIYVDRTSSKGEIRPYWYVRLLFVPPGYGTGWSDQLFTSYVDDPRTKVIFDRQVTHCLDEILRPARDVETLMDGPVKRNMARKELHPLQEALIVATRGYFDHAADGLEQYLTDERIRLRGEREGIDVFKRPQSRPWHRETEIYNRQIARVDHLSELLRLLRAGDKGRVAELLRQWEEAAALARKIGRLWQPMPFPFETSKHAIRKTPSPQLKSSLASLTSRRADVALVDRYLFLRPVRHLVRAIHFEPSPTGIRLRPRWSVRVPFAAPRDVPFELGRRFAELEWTFDNFETLLTWYCDRILDERLRPIEDLTELAHDLDRRTYDHAGAQEWQPDDTGRYRVPLLAALGQTSEARDAMYGVVLSSERRHTEMLKHNKSWLTKRPDSTQRELLEKLADSQLALIAQHKRLLALLEREDRPAIAALLHEWERENVKRWGVEHLWEPTPFPIELGAGG